MMNFQEDRHGKVLLLGASGLLGHNVLAELLKRGFRVRAAVRRESALRKDVVSGHMGNSPEISEGNILDERFLASCASGCDTIINCAGTTDMSLRRLENYLPVNYSLPISLTRILDGCGVHTLIDVSTANTIGSGSEAMPADESFPFSFPFTGSLYAQSKVMSERALLDYVSAHPEKKVIIVNPGFMIGPYDTKPSSGKLLVAGHRRPLMAAPRGGKSFIDVRDAATAIVNAIDMGRSGERYLLTGRSISLREFYRMQAELCGYRQRFIGLPDFVCHIAGLAGDLVRLSGFRCSVCTINVNQLLACEHYDNSKAVKELGMPETPIDEAVKAFWKDREAA